MPSGCVVAAHNSLIPQMAIIRVTSQFERLGRFLDELIGAGANERFIQI